MMNLGAAETSPNVMGTIALTLMGLVIKGKGWQQALGLLLFLLIPLILAVKRFHRSASTSIEEPLVA